MAFAGFTMRFGKLICLATLAFALTGPGPVAAGLGDLSTPTVLISPAYSWYPGNRDMSLQHMQHMQQQSEPESRPDVQE